MNGRKQIGWIAMVVVFLGCQGHAEEVAPELKLVEQVLQPVLENLEPDAERDASGWDLEIAYLTRHFMVHGRSMTGEVSKEAGKVIGPSYKGFLLRVNLQPVGEINQAVVPQTLREPYWKTDLDVVPIAGSDKQLFWALSYGSRSNEKVLAEVRKALKGLAQNGRSESTGGAPEGRKPSKD